MTTPESTVSKYLLLPELKLLEAKPRAGFLVCETKPKAEQCRRCGLPSEKGYDRRRVRIKDIPMGAPGCSPMKLYVLKRRLWCVSCAKPFSETIPGVLPRRRTTERFRRAVMWGCNHFGSLKDVCKTFEVSSDFVYQAFYEQLELKRRMDNQYPWPTAIGLDEHGFGRNLDRRGGRAFVTMVVNQSKGTLMEVVFGKATGDLRARLAHIPGRENVRYATIDMYDGYRSWIKESFPQAEIVADKFHVLRLLSPAILKERRKIVGTNADRRARGLLLRSTYNMDWEDRLTLSRYLQNYPRLHELWHWKEKLHSLYRIRGHKRAEVCLEQMTKAMALSREPEIKRLANTLLKWRQEVLNYFKTRLTNARLEGFNNKAALVRRRAYGYRNPNNYRLRLLSVCS